MGNENNGNPENMRPADSMLTDPIDTTQQHLAQGSDLLDGPIENVRPLSPYEENRLRIMQALNGLVSLLFPRQK